MKLRIPRPWTKEEKALHYKIAQSMKFSFELEDFMRDKEITLEEMANVMGIMPASLEDIFSGDVLATKAMANAVEKKYGIFFGANLSNQCSFCHKEFPSDIVAQICDECIKIGEFITENEETKWIKKKKERITISHAYAKNGNKKIEYELYDYSHRHASFKPVNPSEVIPICEKLDLSYLVMVDICWERLKEVGYAFGKIIHSNGLLYGHESYQNNVYGHESYQNNVRSLHNFVIIDNNFLQTTIKDRRDVLMFDIFLSIKKETE